MSSQTSAAGPTGDAAARTQQTAPSPATIQQTAPTPVRVLNDNGAWCWFQDERALIDPVAGTLLVGSIAAPEGAGGAERAGNVELAVHDLATGATRVVEIGRASCRARV